MGLFSAKTCSLCGDKAGMLNKLKLSEGYLCGSCKKQVSGFSSGWKSRTIDDVKAHLQVREANREVYSHFAADRTIGPDGILQVDSRQGVFILAFGRDWSEHNPQVFPLTALTNVMIEPQYDLTTDDADGDGIPDRFDATPGASASPVSSMGGMNSFDATTLERLAMSSGVSGSIKAGMNSRDQNGYPREIRSLALIFTLGDPVMREATWRSPSFNGRGGSGVDVFNRCVEVVQAVQQLRGMGAPGMMPGAVPGAVPGMMPGAMPGAMPGMVPGAMPGMTPGMMPGAGQMPQTGYPAQTGYPYQQGTPGYGQGSMMGGAVMPGAAMPGAVPPGMAAPGAYPQQGGAFPPQGGVFPQQGGAFPPQGGTFPQQGGFPAQPGQAFPPDQAMPETPAAGGMCPSCGAPVSGAFCGACGTRM